MLAHYVQICCLPNGICLLGSTSSLAWCKVLDYRLAIPALEKPDYKQLLSFVEAALEATVAADWSEEFEPKMHWSLHINSQSLQRHGQLPACWTMERKHKGTRKHGNVLCNTTYWETSLRKSVIAGHIYTLGEESRLFREGTCLQNAKRGPHKEDDGIPMQCWRGSCGNALHAELSL